MFIFLLPLMILFNIGDRDGGVILEEKLSISDIAVK
jgi:hypothetical protein